MKKLLISLALIFMSIKAGGSLHEPNFCSLLFSRSSDLRRMGSERASENRELAVDGTEGFIAYLSTLIENQIIKQAELQRLNDALENGTIVNPFLVKDVQTSSIVIIHQSKIQEHIESASLDQTKLLNWSREALRKMDRLRRAREHTRAATVPIHKEMEFHRVEPGSFEMGHEGTKVSVTLTHPFEMMSTPVTQKHWVELMGENPSIFFDGADTEFININGKMIQLQPNNPVEMITWWSAAEFANRLSVKMGLRPVYDFSKTTPRKGTSAQKGTLDILNGQLQVYPLDGDIYEEEGFRLPTEAEYEYMLRAAGASNGEYSFRNDETNVEKYAWSWGNSKGISHGVGELDPLVIGDKKFYDLYGNVLEWTNDWYDLELRGGENPQGQPRGSAKVMRGCSWLYDAKVLKIASRWLVDPWCRSSDKGFRLVRTIK